MSSNKIADIERVIINVVEGTKIFSTVASLALAPAPTAFKYPCAYVVFDSDENVSDYPRPIYSMVFSVLIMFNLLTSDSNTIYGALEAVEQAINGKQLGLSDIEPFKCIKRELNGYYDGIIAYTVSFRTRHYLDVPT